MQADIRNTVTAALTARDTLAASVHNVAHELEQLDTQPVVVALARLSDAIDSVHSTLGMLRARAAGILSAGAVLFAEFAVDVTSEPVPAQAEQPQVEPVSEPDADQADADAWDGMVKERCEVCNDADGTVQPREDGLAKCSPCQRAHDELSQEIGADGFKQAIEDIHGVLAEEARQVAANDPAPSPAPARKGRNRKAKK
jgi:hypothetical protein